jgi:signal peptidase II
MKPMQERSYRKLFWTLVVVGLVLDQCSKYGVFSYWLYNRGQGAQYDVVSGYFEITAQYSGTDPRVNQGALFGFANSKGTLANTAFALVSFLAAAAIVYWSSLRSTARDWSLCTALGLILAGTLGNLYDRLVFSGVRDFIYWHYRDLYDWPVFNIADCCLVCGAVLLLAQAFLSRPVHATEPSGDRAVASEMAQAK